MAYKHSISVGGSIEVQNTDPGGDYTSIAIGGRDIDLYGPRGNSVDETTLLKLHTNPSDDSTPGTATLGARLRFEANDDSGLNYTIASIAGVITDPTAGATAGELILRLAVNGVDGAGSASPRTVIGPFHLSMWNDWNADNTPEEVLRIDNAGTYSTTITTPASGASLNLDTNVNVRATGTRSKLTVSGLQGTGAQIDDLFVFKTHPDGDTTAGEIGVGNRFVFMANDDGGTPTNTAAIGGVVADPTAGSVNGELWLQARGSGVGFDQPASGLVKVEPFAISMWNDWNTTGLRQQIFRIDNNNFYNVTISTPANPGSRLEIDTERLYLRGRQQAAANPGLTGTVSNLLRLYAADPAVSGSTGVYPYDYSGPSVQFSTLVGSVQTSPLPATPLVSNNTFAWITGISVNPYTPERSYNEIAVTGPAPGDAVTIEGTTLTADADFAIGGTDNDTAINLASAINSHPALSIIINAVVENNLVGMSSQTFGTNAYGASGTGGFAVTSPNFQYGRGAPLEGRIGFGVVEQGGSGLESTVRIEAGPRIGFVPPGTPETSTSVASMGLNSDQQLFVEFSPYAYLSVPPAQYPLRVTSPGDGVPVFEVRGTGGNGDGFITLWAQDNDVNIEMESDNTVELRWETRNSGGIARSAVMGLRSDSIQPERNGLWIHMTPPSAPIFLDTEALYLPASVINVDSKIVHELDTLIHSGVDGGWMNPDYGRIANSKGDIVPNGYAMGKEYAYGGAIDLNPQREGAVVVGFYHPPGYTSYASYALNLSDQSVEIGKFSELYGPMAQTLVNYPNFTANHVSHHAEAYQGPLFSGIDNLGEKQLIVGRGDLEVAPEWRVYPLPDQDVDINRVGCQNWNRIIATGWKSADQVFHSFVSSDNAQTWNTGSYTPVFTGGDYMTGTADVIYDYRANGGNGHFVAVILANLGAYSITSTDGQNWENLHFMGEDAAQLTGGIYFGSFGAPTLSPNKGRALLKALTVPNRLVAVGKSASNQLQVSINLTNGTGPWTSQVIVPVGVWDPLGLEEYQGVLYILAVDVTNETLACFRSFDSGSTWIKFNNVNYLNSHGYPSDIAVAGAATYSNVVFDFNTLIFGYDRAAPNGPIFTDWFPYTGYSAIDDSQSTRVVSTQGYLFVGGKRGSQIASRTADYDSGYYYMQAYAGGIGNNDAGWMGLGTSQDMYLDLICDPSSGGSGFLIGGEANGDNTFKIGQWDALPAGSKILALYDGDIQGGAEVSYVERTGRGFFEGGLASGLNDVSYGANISIDASLGSIVTIVVTDGNAFQIDNPTNPRGGQFLTIRVINNSGGAMGLITWDTQYRLAAFTNPADGFSRSVTFYWDGAGAWVELHRTMADVPN